MLPSSSTLWFSPFTVLHLLQLNGMSAKTMLLVFPGRQWPLPTRSSIRGGGEGGEAPRKAEAEGRSVRSRESQAVEPMHAPPSAPSGKPSGQLVVRGNNRWCSTTVAQQQQCLHSSAETAS